VSLDQWLQALGRLAAASSGVVHERLLEQLDGCERGGTADGVATERRSVVALAPAHQVGAGDHRAQRHAGRDALGGGHDVGLDAPVLDRPHLAGATSARLDLVGHEQDPVLVADTPQARQERVIGDDVPALALDWLHDDRRDLVRGNETLEDARLQLVQACAAERDMDHAGQQRPEAGVVLGLGCRQ
jgi:hypothetical protein